MISKDLRAYLNKLRGQGYILRQTSRGHCKIYFDGELVATAGGGTNQRTIKNLTAEIRRFERQQPGR